MKPRPPRHNFGVCHTAHDFIRDLKAFYKLSGLDSIKYIIEAAEEKRKQLDQALEIKPQSVVEFIVENRQYYVREILGVPPRQDKGNNGHGRPKIIRPKRKSFSTVKTGQKRSQS